MKSLVMKSLYVRKSTARWLKSTKLKKIHTINAWIYENINMKNSKNGKPK